MTRQERELRKIDKRWEYLLKTYGGRPMQELLERLDNSLKENAALQAENEKLKRAVEFAGYMKQDAEALIAAQNELNALCGEDGQEHDCDDIVNAELKAREAMQSLRSAIYEFAKRLPHAG